MLRSIFVPLLSVICISCFYLAVTAQIFNFYDEKQVEKIDVVEISQPFQETIQVDAILTNNDPPKDFYEVVVILKLDSESEESHKVPWRSTPFEVGWFNL